MNSCSASAIGAALGLGKEEVVAAQPTKKQAAGYPDTNLFVSPTLEFFEEPKSKLLPNEITCIRETEVVRFRKLTPPYFAWIHKQFSRAELQYEQGNVDDTDMAELCERYFCIRDWVCERVGLDKLIKLLDTTDVSRFKPPQNTVRRT